MVGAFYQPKHVIIDTDCLKTLPAREFARRHGRGDQIRHHLGCLLLSLARNQRTRLQRLDGDALSYAIRRCCEIKADVVGQDETEHGVRALLNLGHTFGHAIEAEKVMATGCTVKPWRRGTMLAAETALARGDMTAQEVARVRDLLLAADLPVKAPSDMDFAAFIRHMRRDKKVLEGKLRLVLPIGIGQAQVVADVTDEQLMAVIESGRDH